MDDMISELEVIFNDVMNDKIPSVRYYMKGYDIVFKLCLSEQEMVVYNLLAKCFKQFLQDNDCTKEEFLTSCARVLRVTQSLNRFWSDQSGKHPEELPLIVWDSTH